MQFKCSNFHSVHELPKGDEFVAEGTNDRFGHGIAATSNGDQLLAASFGHNETERRFCCSTGIVPLGAASLNLRDRTLETI